MKQRAEPFLAYAGADGFNTVIECLGCSYFSSLIVFLGVAFGWAFLEKCTVHDGSLTATDYFRSCAAWDGVCYCEIVDSGYIFTPGKVSNAAFFPGFPLLGWIVKTIAGVRSDIALLIVSNVLFVVNVLLFKRYLQLRNGFYSGEFSLSTYIIILYCIFPTTYFFRMAYSESLFCSFFFATFLGIQRRWAPVYLALLAGAATGTRSFGVVLAIPVLMHLWESAGSARDFLFKMCYILPICFWGLFAFMLFQHFYLGDAMAFLKAQEAWEFRKVPSIAVKLRELLTFWPIRGTYYKNEPVFYWNNYPPINTPLVNLMFWNPVFWASALILIVGGYWRKVICAKEAIVSLGLLLIPYYIQGPRGGMVSCGRYATVIFPAFIVAGHILTSLPEWLRMFFISVCGILLFLYAAFFSQWYFLF